MPATGGAGFLGVFGSRPGEFLAVVAAGPLGEPSLDPPPVIQEHLAFAGFDGSRGGDWSFRDGSETLIFRETVRTAFPEATIEAGAVLTDEFLSDVSVLVLSAVRTGRGSITPLTPTEQDVLYRFVDDGGGLMIFVDNELDFQLASDSLLRPFGLHSRGTLHGIQPATVYDPASHPITSGVWGEINTFRTAATAWFDDLGENAYPLAALDANGEACLAVMDPGTLSRRSGGVVYFSDSSIIENWLYPGNNRRLVLNSLDYVRRQ